MTFAASWQEAYARQAGADFETFRQLQKFDDWVFPRCHKLHFLQMACEKLCKAHLCGQDAPLENLQASHRYVAKPLPTIVRNVLAKRSGAK